MKIHGIEIEATFAEAFEMTATRIIVTAATPAWVRHATDSLCGFATSVIGCGVEAAVERTLAAALTPDGRPGASVLLFAMRRSELEKQLVRRIGQCVLTCPSTAAFAGIADGNRVAMGSGVRHFGDGHQISKIIGGIRYWRIPVMDGEFLCQEDTGTAAAIGGGNFLVLAEDQAAALHAVDAAVAAIAELDDVILPFPGGVARSGSKVGSKYRSLPASTNDAFCPTLRSVTQSSLPVGCGAALEIVIDGFSEAAIAEAMRRGIDAACQAGARRGLLGITAGNYGGRLGKYHFHLHEVLQS